MKKLLITFLLVMLLTLTMVVVSSAQEITVVDDGTTEITLGECVIEGLDREIPSPSNGFTYVLNTDTKTAKITNWANYADAEKGVTFCTPSTVTYDGQTYTVTTFNRVTYGTDNGLGQTNQGNFILIKVYISDTIVSMPASAFDNCKALEYVYIGNGLETWGERAFHFAGTTVGSYYVDDGTGTKVVLETTGANMGDIKEFILKSKKVTEMPAYIFHHTEFAKDAYIEMDITQFTTFGSMCISLNPYALTDNHHFKGTGLRFDVFDLRNATSIANDAFTNAYGGNTMIVYAEQTKYFNGNSIRGASANYYNPETGNDGTFIIIGGETPETARTLGGPIWTANLHYWYGSTVFMNFYIKGYVKAYDGTDGAENQNGYGIDQVDYYFESNDALNYYINSVKTTTNADTTFTRYAKNTKGYFNVCNGDGTYSAYNLKYTAASEGVEAVVALEAVTSESYIKTPLTYNMLLDGYCTESILCLACDRVKTEGIKHEYNTTVAYSDFTQNGTKTTGCTHDYCALYANPVVVELGAIFSEFYYSVREDETLFGLVMTYKVNNEALAEYETVNGHLNFGVMAIAKKRITTTEGESEVITNPLKNDGTTELSNVVVANVSSNTLASVNLIITGSGDAWEEAKDVEFYVLGFAVNGEALQYFQNSSNTSIGELSTITYNDAKEVA